jgi:hypothetical protein
MAIYRDGTPVIEPGSEEEPAEPSQSSDSGESSLYTQTQTESMLSAHTTFQFAFQGHALKVSAHSTDPKLFAEAMRGPDAEHWFKAAYDETQTQLDNGTWKLENLTPRQKHHWESMGVYYQAESQWVP